jgi:hypothetical protein
MRKVRRIPAPEEVPRIFDDKCIQVLAKLGKLSWAANIPRFTAGVRKAAEVFISDASAASDNEVHYEVDGLLRAASRAVKARKRKDAACGAVALQIEDLSERARKLLNERGTLPDPDILRDPATQHAACETVASLCRIGAFWQEGRRRPGGKRSLTMVPVLHAPALEQHPARREAHLYFISMLRTAVLEATGMLPPLTANHDMPTSFAEMAQVCLDKLQAGANAVKLINALQRRRKFMELR